MTRIIYFFIKIITKLHHKFLTLNDASGLNFTDKQLHFLVIGALGFAMMALIQPVFSWLNKKGYTVLITFSYVFTVILAISFAIEIGQGMSGTGDMDFKDILFGLIGFFVFVAIYFVLYIIREWMKKEKRED